MTNPKPTDTGRSGDLVKRLRKRREVEIIGGYERIEWEDEDALEAADRIEALEAQIDRLASFIMHCIEGEPSQSQGAVDTAIRIMTEQATTIGEQLAEIEWLRGVLEAVWKEATTMRNASKLVGPYPKEPANNRVWARSMYHAGKKLHELIKPIRAALEKKQ